MWEWDLEKDEIWVTPRAVGIWVSLLLGKLDSKSSFPDGMQRIAKVCGRPWMKRSKSGKVYEAEFRVVLRRRQRALDDAHVARVPG